MNINKIDYRALAVRSIKDPTLALYACCPRCGGDIGVHQSTALFLDSVFHTGVKFCDHVFSIGTPPVGLIATAFVLGFGLTYWAASTRDNWI